MALDQEARAEALDTYKLMSADELNAQLGDNADHDELIQEVLAKGNAVEVKGPQMADDEHSGQAGTHHSLGAGDDDDDDDDVTEVEATAGDDAEPAADAAPDATPAAAAEVVEEVAAEVPELAPEAAPAPALAPVDFSYLTPVYDEKLNALDTAKAAEFKKLMAGEIEPEQYSLHESQYLRARDALREERQHEEAWVTQVHKFHHQALAETGVDYLNDKEKGAALDDWLKRFAEKPEAASWTEDQYLQAAHKKVLAEFDIAPKVAAPAPAAQPAPAAKPAPVVKKGRAPDLSTIPPTLSNLPAAASPGNGDGGEFAHLAGLSGYALEKACFAMTPDQQVRYLSE